MPRTAVEDNQRIQIQVTPQTKAKLDRAAAIMHTDLAHFVVQTSLREADVVIETSEAAKVSERNFSRILELLENPPAPTSKLRAAIALLPDTL